MAFVRNVSEHTLDLKCIGRSVEPDEKVEVPDDVFTGLNWPATIWDTDAPKTTKTTTAKKG